MVPAPSSGSMACVQQIRASIRRGSPAAHARLPRNPDALSPHSRRESNANPSRREAPGRLARARHNANASRKARAGRKGREDSGTAKTKREGNGETRRERQPLPPPCTPFIPYSRLREKGRGRCARNGRKNIWGGDGKGGGKKREPAPPSEARANPSRKHRHGRARQTLCRSLRRSLPRILPEGTEGASGRKTLGAPRPKSARNSPGRKGLRTTSAGRPRCKTTPDGWA